MQQFKYEMNTNTFKTIEGHTMKATRDGKSVPVSLQKNYVIQWGGRVVAARFNGQWYANPARKTNPNLN